MHPLLVIGPWASGSGGTGPSPIHASTISIPVMYRTELTRRCGGVDERAALDGVHQEGKWPLDSIKLSARLTSNVGSERRIQVASLRLGVQGCQRPAATCRTRTRR